MDTGITLTYRSFNDDSRTFWSPEDFKKRNSRISKGDEASRQKKRLAGRKKNAKARKDSKRNRRK